MRMKPFIPLTYSLLIVMLAVCASVYAANTCSTQPNSVGFNSEASLDKFIALAKAASKDPSKGAEMKALLKDLASKQEAFELQGSNIVEVVSGSATSDDGLGKIQVKSSVDNKVFWVPSGALECN
jgi:hypothetical protein